MLIDVECAAKIRDNNWPNVLKFDYQVREKPVWDVPFKAKSLLDSIDADWTPVHDLRQVAVMVQQCEHCHDDFWHSIFDLLLLDDATASEVLTALPQALTL